MKVSMIEGALLSASKRCLARYADNTDHGDPGCYCFCSSTSRSGFSFPGGVMERYISREGIHRMALLCRS
jgi:hypothetical protein